MKVLFTILIALLIYTHLPSQWVQQNPLTYQTDITSVYFTNSNNGWAAADYGMIFNTTDGGANWSPISNQPELREKLNSIFFVDNTTGYAVGYNGTIYKISGTSTAQQVSNTTMNLLSVFFTSPDIGYCSGNGGTILKTTNRGTTWVKLTTGTNYSLSSIYFTDSNTGYAVGGQNINYIGIILKTTDAGATWKVKYSGQANRYLYSVHFENSTTGWVCGWNGTILKTTNGGTSWLVQPRIVTSNLKTINFRTLQEGMAAGTDGSILKTTNGGTNWVKLTSGTNVQLNSAILLSGNSAITAGNTGMLLQSENNGTTWVKNLIVNNMNLEKVFFASKDSGWINSSGLIYKTTDGGQTWKWIKAVNPAALRNIFFLDDKIAWVVVENALIQTTNGGADWIEKFKYTEQYFTFKFSSVFFIDKYNGWAVGNNDEGFVSVFYSTDGGKTWIKGNIDLSPYYGDAINFGDLIIYFKDKTNGWILGSNNAGFTTHLTFSRSTDGGKNWNAPMTFLNSGFHGEWSMLKNIAFADPLNGFAIGGSEFIISWEPSNGDYAYFNPGFVIRKTQDGGNTWSDKSYNLKWCGLENYHESRGIYFSDDTTGYITGDNGILKTTDGGNSWLLQKTPVECNLHSIHFADTDNGWAVGSNGVILKYQKDIIPAPFNWESVIEFSGQDQSGPVLLKTLTFGQDSSATNGLDNQLGETDLPPVPPQGTFDARFVLTDNANITSNKDIRNINENNIIWDINLQYQTFPLWIYWTYGAPLNLYQGEFHLVDGIDGSFLNVNMKDSLRVLLDSKPPYNSLKIIYSRKIINPETIWASYNSAWNLVSVPLKSTYMTPASLFSESASDVFGFDGKYFTADVLENGKGYWVKFNSGVYKSFYGTQINFPININKGWNLIGPFSNDVPVEQITTQPAGIITSPFYGFENSYYNASVLSPGRGYWVKAGSDGEIIYNTGTGKSNRLLADIKENWGKIIIDDNQGNSSTLYDVLDDEVNLKQYELPPLPPNGVFDARFSSGLMAERLNSEGKSIQLSSAAYPISIKAEGIDLRLSYNVKGKPFEEILQNGNSYTINESSVKIVEVKRTSDRTIPKEFTLHQNYPNPFNPKTKIKFDIPEKTNVNISIYNLLGERIAELIHTEMEAGYHEVDFNANSLSSGIYFYRIDTDKNHSVKKMMLMK